MLVAVALAPTFWSGVALIRPWQLCTTLVIINGITLRQQQVTPNYLFTDCLQDWPTHR